MRRSPSIIVLALFVTWARSAYPQAATLAEIVRLALARNESSRIARLSVVSAEAAVVKARAGFLPSIALAAEETLRPFSVEQEGRTTLKTNSASGKLAVSQPLLSLPAFPLYASAKHSLKSAVHNEVDQRRQLAFSAARAFFSIIAQQRLLIAAEQRLERATAMRADAQARAAAQLVSTNDVTRAQVEHAAAAQAVADAKGALDQARISLEYLMDAPLASSLRPPQEQLGPSSLDIARLTKRALAQRPDLASVQADAQASAALVREPQLRLAPALGSVAQLHAADQQIAGDKYFDTTFLLTLNWSIWDGGIREAERASRQAAAETARLQVAALRRSVSADVRSAVAAFYAAREALQAAEQGVTAARRSADESSILYKQGLAKAIEVVDANLSRFTAEQTLASAQLALQQAALDLRAALGLFPVDGVK